MSSEDQPKSPLILGTLETPTLTKAELAEMLFDRLGLNKRESKDMVEAFFEIVQGVFKRGLRAFSGDHDGIIHILAE